jgi:hypothetical protein
MQKRQRPDCIFSELNTQPTCTPVYASLNTSRCATQNSGPSGSLLLSRRTLAFPASCRFIPAHCIGDLPLIDRLFAVNFRVPTIQRGFRVRSTYSKVRFSPIQYRGPGPSRLARSPGLANWQSRSDKQPQPMHRVRPARSRSSSAMRSSIRLVQLEESFAQSARSGTRFAGSLASSTATSWSVRPIRWAKTMNAIRRSAALGYRR